VKIVCESWKELATSLMNGCWKISYPDEVHSFEGFDISSVHIENAIVANEARFQDVSENDVGELLESHFLPLMNELAESVLKGIHFKWHFSSSN
jgi:hypothetical protein